MPTRARPRATRGVRRLTADEIVAAGRLVVESSSLDELTIRAVAERLGCSPMAIYRHVTDRDELVDRVVDESMAGVALPGDDLEPGSWLMAMADTARRQLLRYPGTAEHLMLNGPTGPHTMLFMDRVCAVLHRLGRPAADEALAYDVLMTTVAVSVSKQLRAEARQLDGVASGRAFAEKSARFGARLPHLRRVAGEFARDYDESFARKVGGVIAAIVAPTGELFGVEVTHDDHVTRPR